MKTPRKLARIKRTANGKIMGRPVKRSGAEIPPTQTEPARLKRYVKCELGPRPIIDPDTQEVIGERPARTVYTYRESRAGRPPVTDLAELLWIVRACVADRVPGLAQDIYDRGEGHSVAAVKQRLTRTRRQMRRRSEDLPDK